MRGKKRSSQEMGSIISSISSEFILSFVSPPFSAVLHQEFCKYSAAMSFSVSIMTPHQTEGDCPRERRIPIARHSSCIMHVQSAYSFHIMGMQQKPAPMESMRSQCTLLDQVTIWSIKLKQICVPFIHYLRPQMQMMPQKHIIANDIRMKEFLFC